MYSRTTERQRLLGAGYLIDKVDDYISILIVRLRGESIISNRSNVFDFVTVRLRFTTNLLRSVIIWLAVKSRITIRRPSNLDSRSSVIRRITSILPRPTAKIAGETLSFLLHNGVDVELKKILILNYTNNRGQRTQVSFVRFVCVITINNKTRKLFTGSVTMI